jgi:adenylyltransferase/sulfurtransferase
MLEIADGHAGPDGEPIRIRIGIHIGPVLAGVIGNLQVVETLKLILGQGEPLIGSLLIYDALRTEFRRLKLKRDVNCPVCGENPTIKELIDYEEFCGLSR